jgi:tape measure protein
MADEKRRLIYELLVEAKGLANGTKQAKGELSDMTRVVGLAKNALAGMFAGFTVAAAVRGLVEVHDEITRITAQLKVFSIEGEAASEAIRAMQDTAVATGSSLQSIANAYKDLADVSETLGLSQAEVAELVDASTRAMIAQGGTAEQAAEQMSTLAFAIEKGNLSQKELKTLLKDNDVLQRAFEIALGKTTAELLEQAKASGLSADELKKVLDVYTQLGQEQDVAPTMERITASLWESTKAFAAAFSEASGLSTAMDELGRAVMPENAENARSFGEALADGLALAFPVLQSLRLEMQALEEQRKQAAENEKKRVEAAAALAARWAPVPITAAEIRESGGIKTTAEERGGMPEVLFEQQLKEQAEANRLAEHYAFLRKLTDDTERGIFSTQQQITMELDTQREIIYDIVDQQKLRQDIEEEQAGNLEETIGKMKAPTLPTDGILDGILEANEAAQVLAHSLQGVFSGAVHNARDFFRVVLQGLAEVAIQKTILAAIGGTGEGGKGGSGMLGFFASLFAAQRGAVFAGGNVVPMALGGVVSSPTMFPLAGGRVGLMGEAGAEAVMPLRRGADGRLGVSGAMPKVIVNNQTGVAAQADVVGTNERLEITLRAAQMGANMAVAEVNRSIRSGYGATASSLSRSYGLRRRV